MSFFCVSFTELIEIDTFTFRLKEKNATQRNDLRVTREVQQRGRQEKNRREAENIFKVNCTKEREKVKKSVSKKDGKEN